MARARGLFWQARSHLCRRYEPVFRRHRIQDTVVGDVWHSFRTPIVAVATLSSKTTNERYSRGEFRCIEAATGRMKGPSVKKSSTASPLRSHRNETFPVLCALPESSWQFAIEAFLARDPKGLKGQAPARSQFLRTPKIAPIRMPIGIVHPMRADQLMRSGRRDRG